MEQISYGGKDLNKILEQKIIGERIFLKALDPDQISQNYIDWMLDEDILRYLACRGQIHTRVSLQEYISKMNESFDNYLFGIYIKKDATYLGNIKIGGIHSLHKYGDMGLLIGEKNEWGKGYATEAIALLTEYVFNELQLNKIIASILDHNKGSYKAFIKAGYREVGVFKRHVLFEGSYSDVVWVEKCHEEKA